jgi:hypothetical protein
MCCTLRQQIQHQHSAYDQDHTNYRPEVRDLFVNDSGHNGYQDESQPRPNRIGNADVYGLQAKRQEKESDTLTHRNEKAGERLRERFGCLQSSGSNHLTDDGD